MHNFTLIIEIEIENEPVSNLGYWQRRPKIYSRNQGAAPVKGDLLDEEPRVVAPGRCHAGPARPCHRGKNPREDGGEGGDPPTTPDFFGSRHFFLQNTQNYLSLKFDVGGLTKNSRKTPNHSRPLCKVVDPPRVPPSSSGHVEDVII